MAPVLSTGSLAANHDAGPPAGSAIGSHSGTAEVAGSADLTDAPNEISPNLSLADRGVAEALRDLIQRRISGLAARDKSHTGVATFYRNRGYTPIWISDNAARPRAKDAIDFLAATAADGLDPADYPVPTFADRRADKLAADELTLTHSILVYARHASIGRVSPARVSAAIDFERRAPDPIDVLTRVASAPDIRAALDAFNPPHTAYRALKAALAAERRDTVGIRADSQPGTAAPTKAGRRPRNDRSDIIIANMERWRWLPHDLGAAYVMVNVPDFTLSVAQGGATIWSTRIVVGKPGRYATPLFTETMKYITVNPTWNVPPSIIRNEYLPVLRQDPGALARVGLRIGRNRDGSLRIYQPPGDRNALGRLRFNFPNRFLVYQHDTPDKHLFEKKTRAYSHGCMRVQNPDRYAEILLSISQPEDGYAAPRLRALYGKGERTINLKRPIPVYVTYQTVFVDASGELQWRADIYGLDRRIINLLHGDNAPTARNDVLERSRSRAVTLRDRGDAPGSFYDWSSAARRWPSGYPRVDPFKVW